MRHDSQGHPRDDGVESSSSSAGSYLFSLEGSSTAESWPKGPLKVGMFTGELWPGGKLVGAKRMRKWNRMMEEIDEKSQT
jgi:hypothetical protein